MARRRAWRLTEPAPPRAVPLVVREGIRRIVAPNPGPMTYNGTNTWLVDWAGGIAVIDPGSDEESHIDAILAETGSRLSHILLTHTHRDHLTGAELLSRRSGAPTCGFARSADPNFEPAIKLREGERVAGLVAVHTPGHAMDHLCFATDDDVLFSGDHVMGWSTSVVPPPPHGDLASFIGNLERVRDRDDRLMLSAHGPAIENPRELVQSLLDHRMAREASIAAVLTHTPAPLENVLARAYINLRPELRAAARANLLSHLGKLEAEGRAVNMPEGWRATT
ncbi:MBL fold metallo-hydrolase [Lichenicola sp.]|uniref:MBL fold metallo-hydrolase n=1 Tax=Lichenicola sp. TaxID=2804529 RepID=UPI003B00BFB1